MRHRASVSDLIGNWVRLDPDVVVAYQPAIVLQRNRESVWNEKELLRSRPLTVTRTILWPKTETSGALLGLLALVRPLATPVGVANVDPEGTGVLEDLAAQPEHIDEVIDEIARRFFVADLSVDAIVTLSVVRRRSHNAVHEQLGVNELLELGLDIATEQD